MGGSADKMASDGPYVVTQSQFSDSTRVLVELSQGLLLTQCTYSIIRLGIPDIIGARILSLGEIAAQLPGMPNVKALHRCLRFLASVGALKESATTDGDFAYGLTPVTAVLQTKAPQPTLAPLFLHWMEPPGWGALGLMHDYLSGDISAPPYEAFNKLPFFDYLGQHPESGIHLSKNLDLASLMEGPLVVDGGPWKKYAGKTILEIGGGLGRTMGLVAEKFPEVNCTSFDLPEVIDQVQEPPPKVTLVKGDMFKSETIPQSDVIFMKHIFHDWDDEASVKILKSVYAALPPDGELIIVDAVVPGPGQLYPGALWVDIWMMVIGGVERMQSDWERLAQESNFTLKSVQTTTMPQVSFLTFSK